MGVGGEEGEWEWVGRRGNGSGWRGGGKGVGGEEEWEWVGRRGGGGGGGVDGEGGGGGSSLHSDCVILIVGKVSCRLKNMQQG